jgi:hypothetical protein
MDAGLVGLVLELFLLRHIVGGVRGLGRAWGDEARIAILVLSLACIVLHTPVSLPVYWLTLLAALEMPARRTSA